MAERKVTDEQVLEALKTMSVSETARHFEMNVRRQSWLCMGISPRCTLRPGCQTS